MVMMVLMGAVVLAVITSTMSRWRVIGATVVNVTIVQ